MFGGDVIEVSEAGGWGSTRKVTSELKIHWHDQCRRSPSCSVFHGQLNEFVKVAIKCNEMVRGATWFNAKVHTRWHSQGNLDTHVVYLTIQSKKHSFSKLSNTCHWLTSTQLSKRVTMFLRVSQLLNLYEEKFVVIGTDLKACPCGLVSFDCSYCVHDRAHRASRTCTAMGMLSQVSSQTSVFILLLMTSYRLYGTLHPFRIEESRLIGGATTLAALSWLTSLGLSFIPQVVSYLHCWIRADR